MAATTTERKTPPEKENDIMAVITPHSFPQCLQANIKGRVARLSGAFRRGEASDASAKGAGV